MKILKLLILSLLLSSCGGLLNDLHSEIDRGYDNGEGPRNGAVDTFSEIKENAGLRDEKIDQQGQYDRGKKELLPVTRREYVSQDQAEKRFKASDLNDQGNSASLWGGDEKSNFLFSYDRKNKVGDIVLVNVEDNLKDVIAQEMSRLYPEEKKVPQEEFENTAENGSPEKRPAAEVKSSKKAPAKVTSSDVQIQDKFTSVIIKEINKNHLILKGRKSIVYKKRKKMIELQALAMRSSILDNDSINSSSFLETKVRVFK